MVSVRRGFLFLLVLGIGCVILLWHSMGLPYNYFIFAFVVTAAGVVPNGSPKIFPYIVQRAVYVLRSVFDTVYERKCIVFEI